MKSYIIAETACSHDGSANRLKKILSFAIKAGFDALQLQIWKKEKVVSKDHKDFKILKKVEIKYQDWKKIINHIKRLSKKIDIICCVYEKESFDFCVKNNVKNFKIHSSDLGNKDFLKYVAQKSKRIDLSIGGCTKDEIIKAVSVIKKYPKCKIWLMYGIQLFPTNPKKINLSSAKKIAKSLNLQLGYQDHSSFDFNGYALPAAAIGNGINIIEKHVTDENRKNRTDGQSAIEIKNYKNFVEICRNSEKLVADKKIKNLSIDEDIYRNYSKKQILYKTDLSKGKILKKENLFFLRTSKKGELVDNLDLFINRKLAKSVKKMNNLKKTDLI